MNPKTPMKKSDSSESTPTSDATATSARCGPATATLDGGIITVDSAGGTTAAIRAACALGWAAVDAGIDVAGVGGVFADQAQAPAR